MPCDWNGSSSGKRSGVANYFADYNSEVKRQIPKNLIDYFWNAEEQMQKEENFL